MSFKKPRRYSGVNGRDLHWALPNELHATDCGPSAVLLALASTNYKYCLYKCSPGNTLRYLSAELRVSEKPAKFFMLSPKRRCRRRVGTALPVWTVTRREKR